MEKLVFGMHHLCVTQIGTMIDGKPHYSHPNYAIDLAGEDEGIDYWVNKQINTRFYCSGKFGTKETGNTRFFVPCDKQGRKTPVLCADGKPRYVTIAMTHSGKDYQIGKIYEPGEVMYQEGTAGRATGNHIHLEIAEGVHTTKTFDRDLGVYRMQNEINPVDVLWILDGYTTVVDSGGVDWKHTDTPRVISSEMKGVDLSNHNVGYVLADHDQEFAIFKATEGYGWVDPLLEGYIKSAKEQGLPYGTYYFARPEQNNPVDDADFYVDAISKAGASDGICVLDWEVKPLGDVEWARKWLKRVEERLGTIPFIYMSLSVANDYDWSSVASKYPLWLAHWAPVHGSTKYWSYPTIWQYNADGVDKDIFYGNKNDWKGYTMGLRLKADKLGMNVRMSPCDGVVLDTVKRGESAIIIGFGSGFEKDGYQWASVDYKGITGYSQLDLQAYKIE